MKKEEKKENTNKIIDWVVKIVLIIIIILLLLHNCELQKKNGKTPNGNVNIIDITCDDKKCNKQDSLVDCLSDVSNSKCVVPNFVGKTKADVLNWLSMISNVIDIEYRTVKSDQKDGTVLEQSVSGISIKDLLEGKSKLVITIADNGSSVDCLSDVNNSKCAVPNFVGKTKNNVQNWLNDIKNYVKVKYVYQTSNAKAGTIISQSIGSGKKVKDIIENGETLVITISSGSGVNPSGGGGSQDDDPEGEFIVYDNKVTWNDSTELKIFENPVYDFDEKIAPEDSNTYQFVLKNSTKYNLKYNISFSETNPYSINLKYKLKKNSDYIISDYVSYDQLNISDQILNSKSSDTFYLEWKWVSSDHDTQAGKIQANYKLSINVEAESTNG